MLLRSLKITTSSAARSAAVTATFLCALTVVTSVVFFGVLAMKEAANKIDDQRAVNATSSALNASQIRIGATARDNAVWDDADTNVRGEDAKSWIYENWGKTSSDYPLYDVAIVYSPERTVIGAYKKGQEFNPETVFGDSLYSLVDKAGNETPRAATMFARGTDGIYVVAAGSIRPFSHSSDHQNYSTLVYAKLLTEEVIQQIAEAFDIKGLRLVAEPTEGALHVPLTSIDGMTVSFLEWPSRLPGNLIYTAVQPYVLSAAVILIGIFAASAAIGFTVCRKLENDVSEERRRANSDSLTGLLNRNGIAAWASGYASQVGILLIDLDGFKDVNDNWGHATGDQLIQLVATRLRQLECDKCAAARLGGDEFVIAGDPDEVESLAAKVLYALQQPFSLPEQAIHISASIGFAAGLSSDMLEVLRKADMALYRAKDKGRNCVVHYTPDLDDERLANQVLDAALREDLRRGLIYPVFQPLTDAVTGRIREFEALARWSRPTGAISPEVFIPLAEQSGLIDSLGISILDQAISTVSGWEDVRIAVNVSPLQLLNPRFAADVVRICEAHHMDPKRLTLEITEGVLISAPDQVQQTMRRLKKVGVEFALDDFGSGYASIGALRTFGFSRIKLDRSLIQSSTNLRNRKVLIATISLVNALGLPVTAEGIENEEEAILAAASGCDLLQGYYIGRPMSGDLAQRLIHSPATFDAIAS